MSAQTFPPAPRPLKPFLILWAGQAVSLLGSNLVQFALIWWLTQETGSATVLAMASLVGMLPQVVLGPFAGVLVDRWNRRWTMFVADTTVALATIVLALLFWTGAVQIWHVYAILFVRSLGGAFHWPAMTASTVLMVPENQLTRVQGLNQMLQGAMTIVAAPLGALLLSLLPVQGVLAIDVVTALFAIVPLLFILVPQPETAVTGDAAPTMVKSFWADMRDGLRYVLGWPGLLVLMALAMLLNLLLTPAFSLLPLLVTDYFGGDAWSLGVIESAFGVGLVAGGLLLGAWGGFKRRIHTSLLGLIGLGISVLAVGLTPAALFWLAVVAMLMAGLTNSMTNGPIFAIMQATVSPQMQGRVFTLLTSLASMIAPLGLIIAGPVADTIGVRSWYLFGGVVTLLAAVGSAFIPALMHIEDGRAAESAGATPVAVTPDTAVSDPTLPM